MNAVLIADFSVRVDSGDAMSIRLIARELYQLQQEVEKLEKELTHAPAERFKGLQDQLRKKRAERDRMRRASDLGASPVYLYRVPECYARDA